VKKSTNLRAAAGTPTGAPEYECN